MKKKFYGDKENGKSCILKAVDQRLYERGITKGPGKKKMSAI